MATVTLPSAQLLTDAGAILWAPLGTAIPANTVAGSVFTDSWPVAWIPLGRTSGGLQIGDNATTADIESAEDYYPLATRSTKRVGSLSFSLMSNTATNLSRALNGAVTTVTGATTTLLTKVSAPNPVNEVPCMIGWESLDGTVRYIAYQVRNAGNLQMQMGKAPNAAQIPWSANLEKPATTQPYDFFYAGANRA